MFKVNALLARADAERLSDLLAWVEPSPADAVSIEEVSRASWRIDAFCVSEEAAMGAASIIEHEVPGARASVQPLEDRDWVAASLEGLPAVRAGPFVVAGAHELAKVAGGRIPVWIEAGPAFGTGHHGTTLGCLTALAARARQGPLGRVLDVGTGSGVLAIAALKAGAASAVATDIDAESLRVARENARNNRVGKALRLVHAAGARDRAIREGAPYDVILANILARPLVGLAPDLAALARPGGQIILSGLLTWQEPQVRAAYAGRGLVLARRLRRAGWSTLVYERPSRPAGKSARHGRSSVPGQTPPCVRPMKSSAARTSAAPTSPGSGPR
jgi:ribosomal protein L11 methyltransferase